MPLPPSFFDRSTLEVAPALLGKLLVYDTPDGARLSGRVVETEAYTQDDPACHGFGVMDEETGELARHRRGYTLFSEPGTGYVYLIYGIYWLLNVVTESKGAGGAVLIRAIEPLEGVETMQERRGVRKMRDISNGPGKLTLAFDIDQRFNNVPLTRAPLYFAEDREGQEITVATSPRIGISKATERHWRYFIEGNPFVSRA